MGKWQIKEEIGKQYIYVSKNGNDLAASIFFANGPAWVSNETVLVNERRVSVGIQYRNKTGVNTTTAPAGDGTNWEFDRENFNTYNNGILYNIGHKTCYNNEFYICNVNGSTSTFQPGNWTKVIISNKDVPFLTLNTALTLANTKTYCVTTAPSFDYLNNKAYYYIHILLSNGTWDENLSVNNKSIRVIGQSKFKTRFAHKVANMFLDNLYVFMMGNDSGGDGNFNNCIFEPTIVMVQSSFTLNFCYNNVFKGNCSAYSNNPRNITHMVNNVFLGYFSIAANGVTTTINSIIKNNYFKDTSYFYITSNPSTKFDYNRFVGTCYINSVAKTNIPSITDSPSPCAGSNTHSEFISAVTFNSDFSVATGSPLLGTGYNGTNIGGVSKGTSFDANSIFTEPNAIYRNVIKNGIYFERHQVIKYPQSAGVSTITLDSTASSIDDTYNGFRIKIVDGLGINQEKTIIAYNGTTKVATIDSPWTDNSGVIPNQFSIYEILDGEIESAIGDLTSPKLISNLNFITNNLQNISGRYDRTVSTQKSSDGPDTLDFQLKYGLVSDLSGSVWKTFKQDSLLLVDINGKNSGDSDFNPDLISIDAIPFQYFKVKIGFHSR